VNERERRVGENEVLYRAVNERIEALNEAFGRMAETMTVVCECGELACAEQIHISIQEYEQLRSDPTLFAVLPGHEIEDVEDVVGRQDAYHVIRKHPGGPAKLATETDPRS
jgi:hypothetical protein